MICKCGAMVKARAPGVPADGFWAGRDWSATRAPAPLSPRPGPGRRKVFSRHDLPELCYRCSSLGREGAGNAGCALHPRSRVPKVCILAHTSIQGSGNTPTSPAQWLYGLLRALPGERACLPPSLADCSASLTPASRRQDHTTSPYAPAFSSGVKNTPDAKASTASHPNVW
jgi:hypothetical protein